MANDAFSSMMAAWKKATDDYLAAWGPTLEAATRSEAGAAALQETAKTLLGARTAMAQAARQVYEPLVQAAGGVPLSEFRRLQDEVHSILLRLDRIDDALAELLARGDAREEAPSPARARRPSPPRPLSR
jgi:hypothetical protein